MATKSAVPRADATRKYFDGNPLKNTLLLNLPEKECESVYSQLVFMSLRTHDVLVEVGAPIQYAYFMNSGLASG
jgi:hypothetical protein